MLSPLLSVSFLPCAWAFLGSSRCLHSERSSLKHHRHIGGNLRHTSGRDHHGNTEKRKGSGNKSQTTEMETPSQVSAGRTGDNIREHFTVVVILELNLRGWGLPGSEEEDKVFEQSEQRKEHLQRLIGCKGQHVNLENQQVISVWLEHRRVCVCSCVYRYLCGCGSASVCLCDCEYVFRRLGWWRRA